MFVCEKCHERDRKVIKCDLDTNSHGLLRINGACGICGNKSGKLLWCHCYEKMTRVETNGKPKI